MLVSDARTRLKAAVLRGNSSYTDADLDYALQVALQDLDLTARVNRLSVNVPMRADDPRVSLQGVCGFMPDRVVRAEIAFTFRGAWQSGTAYTPVDMVTYPGQQGFYVCTTGNTASASNAPGTEEGNSYWQNQLWRRGNKVDLVTYETIARQLGDGSGAQWAPLVAWPFPWAWDQVARGMPTRAAFFDQDTAYVFPVPTSPWKLCLIMESPVADWIPGEQDPDIDLPPIALYPTIDIGAASHLEPSTTDGQLRAAKWELMKSKIRGRCIIANGDEIKNPTSYLDHTDFRSFGYGYGFGQGRGL